MSAGPAEPYSLRFEWTPTKTSSGHGLLLQLLDDAQGAASGDVGYKYAEVVAYNTMGKRHVIKVLDTDDEARDRASAIEDDFGTMTVEEWCERYGLPRSFVTE